jgi:UDP-N-acetylglucosamine 2-epimerase (non-hydrolysing)
VSVVGARPQFVKLAPVAEALTARGVDHVIVHTGQHYDERMSASFFADLVIPHPDVNLEVGSGLHGRQTADMMTGLEPVLTDRAPDWVLTYGDTNSTLAAAIVAVKLHLPLAHVEAGLRSFNRRMPEEHNRVLTDHASDLLLAPTRLAVANLTTEGLAARSVLVGDVMADVCLRVAAAVGPPAVPDSIDPGAPFVLATIHRPENTDDDTRLAAVVAALQACTTPVVLAAHPRLRDRAASAGIPLQQGAVRLVEPYGYPDMIATLKAATAVVTDSGGLQKEAYLLSTPCTTLRTETEWVETMAAGWNLLDPELLHQADWVRRAPVGAPTDLYGDGHAAQHVAAALIDRAGR